MQRSLTVLILYFCTLMYLFAVYFLVHFHKTNFMNCATGTGYLVTCVIDLRVILTQALAVNESTLGSFKNNKKLQISLMEPTIEYIMKCIFSGLSQVCDDVYINLFTGFGQYYVFLVPYILF